MPGTESFHLPKEISQFDANGFLKRHEPGHRLFVACNRYLGAAADLFKEFRESCFCLKGTDRRSFHKSTSLRPVYRIFRQRQSFSAPHWPNRKTRQKKSMETKKRVSDFRFVR